MNPDGFPWNDVAEKSYSIIEQLLTEGYSSQDIAFIGLLLQMRGQYMWMKEGFDHIKAEEAVE